MNNKHHAVWAIIALLIVFLALLLWRLFDPTPRATAPGDVATTTPAQVAAEPVHIIDTGEFYEIDAAYPSATPLRASAGREADAQAVALMRSFAQNSVVSFKEANNLDHMTAAEFQEIAFGRDAKYAMGIEYTLYESPKTVTYVYIIYQDTLGAHPNTYYRTFTFDRETGENIHLDELFAAGTPYLERLSERARADLPRIMARIADISPEEVDRANIESGTVPIADAFQNFAIEGSTLRLIFPPYQVGPYAYGSIEVPIPLSDLADILDPRYRP